MDAIKENAPPLTSGAYFENRSARPKEVELMAYAGMLKIKYPQRTTELKRPPALRGTVQGFSRAARKRMIEFMARVRNVGSMLFCTLTYPDLFPVNDPDTWKRHFENFRDRFEHHYPTFRAIWRMEIVDRKSGVNQGIDAPHFHLLVFMPQMPENALEAVSESIKDTFLKWWFEIVGSGDEYHRQRGVDVQVMRSLKHAMKYVSKYIAKETVDSHEVGRRWGRIGAFDVSSSQTVLMSHDEYVTFKRIIRAWMRKHSGKFDKRRNKIVYSTFHKRFASLSSYRGCSVFGMGDTLNNWLLWVYEAFRQVHGQ